MASNHVERYFSDFFLYNPPEQKVTSDASDVVFDVPK